MHLFLELWKPKRKWLDLTEEERQEYVESIQPSIGDLLEEGVELVGIGAIDADTDQRAEYDFWAVWRIPSDERVERFERQVREDGFYEYFEQINARGLARTPEEVFGALIAAGEGDRGS